MIIQNIKLKSTLTYDELMKVAQERKPQFEALKGLIQKYYVKYDSSGEYGGIYVWDSRESMMQFRESELAKTIAGAYKLTGPPEVEVIDVIFTLR